MLRGALAAAVTPLRDEGAALDEEAFRPYLDFLSAGGLDGILALGTTGEGILLSAAERRRAAELFVEDAPPDRPLRRADDGRDRRPRSACGRVRRRRRRRDRAALLRLRRRGPARALRRRGPAASRSLLRLRVQGAKRLRDPADAGRAPPRATSNLAGLKVSDRPFDAVEPYLLEGLDVFVGAEDLALRGLRARCRRCRLGARRRLSGASRRARPRPDGGALGRGRGASGGARARPVPGRGSSSSSASAESRSAVTSARRCVPSPRSSAAS